MHSNRRRVLGAVLIALMLAATAACSGDSTGATPPPITSTAAEGLTIGISFDEPGIGFKIGQRIHRFRRADRDLHRREARRAGRQDHLEGSESRPIGRRC